MDHVLGEGVEEDGACFHGGDDGFPQLFKLLGDCKGELELLEVLHGGISCGVQRSWWR